MCTDDGREGGSRVRRADNKRQTTQSAGDSQTLHPHLPESAASSPEEPTAAPTRLSGNCVSHLTYICLAWLHTNCTPTSQCVKHFSKLGNDSKLYSQCLTLKPSTHGATSIAN